MADRDSVFVDAPLVLVSQVQRSGGSLLAQLFDGHPQVYAHPLELRLWHPDKGSWPVLDLEAGSAEWFEVLGDERWDLLARTGYAKRAGNRFAAEERHPFTFSQDEQRRLFLELTGSRVIRTQRDVLDCYFTSFFRSWGDWEPTGRERVVTGFLPRVVYRPASLARFRGDYPDGKLISIVRDPRSWYASTSRHRKRDEDVTRAIGKWLESAAAIGELARSGADWAHGVVFDDLVLAPEAALRRIAAFVGIDYDERLLEPTYAGLPVRPNSSFDVPEYGINPAMAKRTDAVSPEALEHIGATALPLYEELVELLGAGAPAAAG